MRRFQTLGELIGLYAQPNQGLVCALLLPVEREREPDPQDDRDASGATRCAVCKCLPCLVFKYYLLLSIPFSQPAFFKAPALTMMPGTYTPFPRKFLITMAFPHTSLRVGGPDGCPTDPCPQMGRMRSPRCPHALAPPAFVPLWGPAAPHQPLRPPQLRLLRGKTPIPSTEQEVPFSSENYVLIKGGETL